MNETVREEVDTRQLKSGQYRLRFRLREEAYELVNTALSLTCYQHSGAALDAISLSFLAGHPTLPALGSPASGSKRLLVRLWPDQFECVRSALDIARLSAACDADALNLICAAFLKTELRYNRGQASQIRAMNPSCGHN
jgi:hypothetical protein